MYIYKLKMICVFKQFHLILHLDKSFIIIAL